MTDREYILAADPFVQPVSGRMMREVMERTDGGPWQVIVVAGQDEAVDVLTALRRACQDGREDKAQEDDVQSREHWKTLRDWLGSLQSAFRPQDVLAKMTELEAGK